MTAEQWTIIVAAILFVGGIAYALVTIIYDEIKEARK